MHHPSPNPSRHQPLPHLGQPPRAPFSHFPNSPPQYLRRSSRTRPQHPIQIDPIRQLAPQMHLAPNNQMLVLLRNISQGIIVENLPPILVRSAPITVRVFDSRVRIPWKLGVNESTESAVQVPFLARAEEGEMAFFDYFCEGGCRAPGLNDGVFGSLRSHSRSMSSRTMGFRSCGLSSERT